MKALKPRDCGKTLAAQAFYDACCAGKEWDVLASLALDLTDDDILSYPGLDLPFIVRYGARGRYDPYCWTSIQPQIDRETTSLREGVRDYYAWRNPWLNR